LLEGGLAISFKSATRSRLCDPDHSEPSANMLRFTRIPVHRTGQLA
jgi:hypothetical protein